MQKLNIYNTGVYAFVNHDMRLVYIGETTRSFLVRWIEHLTNEKTWKNKEKVRLLLDNATSFEILKILELYKKSKPVFMGCERYYCELFKEKGYKVINATTAKFPPIYGHKKNRKNKEIIINPQLIDSYRFCFKKIVLSLSNKNNISTKDIYIWSYKIIEKKFGSSFYNRKGESILDKLNLEELEYIVYTLFPKYKEYIINTKRIFFAKMSKKELEEWFIK